ncbi:alpha-ketoacid dehydrogenase subunit alpha/beta [Bradyrhizobium liaoningense]
MNGTDDMLRTVERPARNVPDLSQEERIALYRDMVRIRAFEDRAISLFKEGAVKGSAHSYVGEEAIAAGVAISLRADDFVTSNHRGHGHCLVKGADMRRMMAELLGRQDGYCHGLGGSMHIADLSLNILGSNGIVGAGIGLAIGAALAAKLDGSDRVGIAFFGDGASSEGLFHEALNLAAVWKLPVVFVCENNQYGLSTPIRLVISGETIAGRAASYGIPGEKIDGNDVEEVYRAANIAIARARAGEGPSLIEALTYRWGEHSMRANLPRYRPVEEEDSWKARDPIKSLREQLAHFGIKQDAVTKIQSEADAEVDDAVAFAKASAVPSETIMYPAVMSALKGGDEILPPAGDRKLGFVQALNEAIRQEMERDDSVFIMGEDIARIGGVFGVTRGLIETFGEDRVRDTPISEQALAAAGVGAAIAGKRPIVELQFFDFVTLAMDMIVNQAAKFKFMLGGKPKVPLVIRGPQGGGVRLAAQHSQSLEAWFAHVPGLVVVAPSTPYDAKGLLISAIRDDNPVIFLEHKLLYLGGESPVPEEMYSIPLGKAEIKRTGKDVTIVVTLAMVPRALQAAEFLARDGISVEVIDPRTIKPFDIETVVTSIRKTHRCVVVHEAWKTGGFGGEIVAQIMEHAFDWLDAPVVRVCAPDVPMPYNDELEREVIPSAARIEQAVRDLIAGH